MLAIRELTVRLPEQLATEAESTGLLEPQAIEQMFREELRRRRVDELFEAADRLAAVGGAPLTAAEVEAEIEAARAERRTREARGG
jgi:hypothetical protein